LSWKRAWPAGSKMSGSSTFSLFSLFIFSLFFYFDRPPLLIIEEDFGSTDFDVLFVDGFEFLKIFWAGLV
jgi:hypothetical protein